MQLSLSAMDGNSVLIFVGMVAGLYVYWKRGGVQASGEVISMYKARDELQDKERKEMRTQISDMTGKIGRLEGIIEEKDKRIKVLESVDISRNPVMLKFMEYLTKVADRSEKYMDFTEKESQQVMSILAEIKTFMGNINSHMEQHKAV